MYISPEPDDVLRLPELLLLVFLSRVSILTHDIDIANMSVRPSVRPSVCPSVTFRYYMKIAERIVILFAPYGSPIILVLSASNIFTKFRRGHPLQYNNSKFI